MTSNAPARPAEPRDAGGGAAVADGARPSLGDQPLGPLDGRYRAVVAPLAQYLSEAALNRERVRVEVEWLIHLASSRAVPGLRSLTGDEIAFLRGIGLSVEDGNPAIGLYEKFGFRETGRGDGTITMRCDLAGGD